MNKGVWSFSGDYTCRECGPNILQAIRDGEGQLAAAAVADEVGRAAVAMQKQAMDAAQPIKRPEFLPVDVVQAWIMSKLARVQLVCSHPNRPRQ